MRNVFCDCRAGVALANGQQAVINVTQVASVVGANVTGAIEATARNGYASADADCVAFQSMHGRA